MRRTKRVLNWLLVSLTMAAFLYVLGVSAYHRFVRTQFVREYLPPGRMVDVGTHRMHIQCEGEGKPTVVLEAGASWFSVAWSPIMKRASSITRICAYDRSGMGWSDPSPEMPNARRRLNDTEKLLAAAGEFAPYIFVGHSAGGIQSWVFAQEHPEQMVGLISVDGILPMQSTRFSQMQEQQQTDELTLSERLEAILERFEPRLEELGFYRFGALFNVPTCDPSVCSDVTIAAIENAQILTQSLVEDAMAGSTLAMDQLLDQSVDFGDLPISIIVAGTPTHSAVLGESERASIYWDLAQRAAALSTNGHVISVPDSSHFVQFDEPEMVIEEIRKMVDLYRAAIGSLQ